MASTNDRNVLRSLGDSGNYNNIISAEPVAEVSKEKTYRAYRNEALVV